jgi:hypothetical protein
MLVVVLIGLGSTALPTSALWYTCTCTYITLLRTMVILLCHNFGCHVMARVVPYHEASPILFGLHRPRFSACAVKSRRTILAQMGW